MELCITLSCMTANLILSTALGTVLMSTITLNVISYDSFGDLNSKTNITFVLQCTVYEEDITTIVIYLACI